MLSAVATILAVAALAANFAIAGPMGPRGPTGATGATGATGPAGPGTLTAWANTTGGGLIGATCTNYPAAEVTITVPEAGTVIVTAAIRVSVSHTAGTQDIVRIFLGTTDTDCTIDDWRGFGTVGTNTPSDTIYMTITVEEPFAVGAAGTYTFFVNGDMIAGAGPMDTFYGAGTVAVFYP